MYGLVPGSDEEEMFRVLALIVAEFRSDPMSVQCFDERIVQRACAVVDKYSRSLCKFNRRQY